MESALKNTIIAKDYGLSLKSFFKDNFKYWDDSYLIPFSHFRQSKTLLSEYIISSCGGDTVCGKLQSCYGHQFLQFIEAILKFEHVAVIQKKVDYKYFFITNFELTSNAKITLIPTKIKKWRVVAIEKQKLDDLTYSERLSFLRFSNTKFKKCNSEYKV